MKGVGVSTSSCCAPVSDLAGGILGNEAGTNALKKDAVSSPLRPLSGNPDEMGWKMHNGDDGDDDDYFAARCSVAKE